MDEQPKKIPIIVDSPRDDPKLGFQKYVEALAAAINGGTPPQFTLGLYGAWGTGKSSILSALKLELAKEKKNTIVTFDAWRHEKVPNLLAPMLWSIQQALVRGKSDTLKAAAGAMQKIFGGLELQAFGFSLRIPSEGDRAVAAEHQIGAYMGLFDSLDAIGKKLGEGERVVVLIDDLDRCSPDSVVEIIEAIRLLTDVRGFVFVIAIDYEVLTDAVKRKYPHADEHKFIEKIVQVPFRIPNIDVSDEALLTSIVPAWGEIKDVWFEDVDEAELRSIIALALRSNPRQIKRMLNSYLLARHISWGTGVEQRLLILSIALQVRWPHHFERLMKSLIRTSLATGANEQVLKHDAVYREYLNYGRPQLKDAIESEDLLKRAEDDGELKEFLERYLDGDTIKCDELLDIMRKTTDIAVTVPMPHYKTWAESKIQTATPSVKDAVLRFESIVESIVSQYGGYEAVDRGQSRDYRLDSRVVASLTNIVSSENRFDLRFPGEEYSDRKEPFEKIGLLFASKGKAGYCWTFETQEPESIKRQLASVAEAVRVVIEVIE